VVTILGAGQPGDLARLRQKPAGRVRLALLARWAHFVALSNEVAAELRASGVADAQITVIPNGVDLSRYVPPTAAERGALRRTLSLDSHRCHGVFVGRLHPVKSVGTLLHALVDAPDVDLLVVGDGQERTALERLTDDLSIAERVRFVGASDDVASYLKAADVFFLPSLGEGMPNALLEAMACGLPCVASERVGGVEELLGGDRARGFTAPGGDIAAWSEMMRQLANDATLRNTRGAAAATYVHANHSLDVTADRLVRLYLDLVSRR